MSEKTFRKIILSLNPFLIESSLKFGQKLQGFEQILVENKSFRMNFSTKKRIGYFHVKNDLWGYSTVSKAEMIYKVRRWHENPKQAAQ